MRGESYLGLFVALCPVDVGFVSESFQEASSEVVVQRNDLLVDEIFPVLCHTMLLHSIRNINQ